MTKEKEYVAIIAGEGKMPELVIRNVHKAGKKVLLIALKGITPEALEKRADDVAKIYVTQVGKAVTAASKYCCKEVIMAGRVPHDIIYNMQLWRMDLTMLRLWWGLKDRKADTILGAIAAVFKKKGITLVETKKYIGEYIAKKGVLTETQPPENIMEDIRFGVGIAKELGRADVGQTVVVKDKAVVAVEAMEGTDRCLERAGEIGGAGCVVVKMAKPQQDIQ